MPDPDLAALDDIESRLADVPTSPELGAASVDEFRRRRARIHQRYNEWRRGMPSLDGLFDDDEHRAKALAGSLATELERTLELYGELATPVETPARWPEVVAAEWRTLARELARCWQWGEEASTMFDLVLDDLSAQAVRRAVAGERPRAERAEVHVSRLRRLRIVAARTVMRFFRPPPGGR